jgi:hypothetical protein
LICLSLALGKAFRVILLNNFCECDSLDLASVISIICTAQGRHMFSVYNAIPEYIRHLQTRG